MEKADALEISRCRLSDRSHGCFRSRRAGKGESRGLSGRGNRDILKEQGGVAYDISAAKPRPRVGYMAVRLSGTKSRKLGICQQGVILEDIQWSYTKKKCE
jgi:hypothetical protein